MSKSDFPSPEFFARIREYPAIRAIQERHYFEAVMEVQTDGSTDYVTARDYARSDQMSGRVRPKPNKRDDVVLWFFELEEDAIQFALKFATCCPSSL